MIASYLIFECSRLLKLFAKKPSRYILFRVQSTVTKIPFFDFYESTTGIKLEEHNASKLLRKHPKLEQLSEARLADVRSALQRLGVCAGAACKQPHVLTMHPLTADNYGNVLRECGFHTLQPSYIIRYHTLVRSRTIEQLKKAGLILSDVKLEERLVTCFRKWLPQHDFGNRLPENETSLLKVRMKIVGKYLNWRLGVSEERFLELCRHYNVLKHRPMADIEEAVDLAQYNMHFSPENIKRHGFLISADPPNTKLILDNVKELAGVEIRQVIRMVPAIVKNNHRAILRIRDLLEEYRIDADAQRRCFMVYCMRPETVQERLAELSHTKEFQVLSSNPRALQMVVHHRKLVRRLDRLRAANKRCYSLHNLLSSAHKFNEYVGNFGDRTCSRDLAAVICASLRVEVEPAEAEAAAAARPRRRTASGESVAHVASPTVSAAVTRTVAQLRRHTYWRNVPPDIVHANLLLLKRTFRDRDIFAHCQLLLYPRDEIQQYLEAIVGMKESRSRETPSCLDPCFGQLQFLTLSDEQVLSLVLYAIEKKYHFTGDGIWSRSDVSTRTQGHGATTEPA